jgi:3',5'-cyclic AMP phosphodiesterase CpdA
MTTPVLIAQISDLHVKRPGELAYEMVDTAAALERCIACLNRFRPRPAFVVISGDLVDRGLEEEYAYLRRLLKPLELPFAAIPGNHDERRRFRQAFSDQCFAQPSGPANLRNEASGLVLLLLDSSVPGKDYGELDAETLRWLDSELVAAPDRPSLVFLHHPPFATGIAHMDRQNLRNAPELAAIVRRHAHVRMIAAGHLHRAVTTLFGGVPASICPAPNHAVDLDLGNERVPSLRIEPPAFHLHAWFAGEGFAKLVTHFVPIGDFPGPYPFFDAGGKLL